MNFTQHTYNAPTTTLVVLFVFFLIIQKYIMVKIVIATMVKDEDDIIRPWIEYYGKLFGYNNLYIIDNFSSDKTFAICNEYLDKGIHLKQERNYKHKGTFMTKLKNKVKCDIFIPIDIDEFMVLYDKDNNIITCDNVVMYLNTLINENPKNPLFKTEYISPIRTNNNSGCILEQFTYGNKGNLMNGHAKTFIQNRIKNRILIDHGNHISPLWNPKKNYILTDLYLVHYHRRGDIQHKKKVKNNVLGLGYKDDLKTLKELYKREGLPGGHHVRMYIKMLENPSGSNEPSIQKPPSNSIDLSPIMFFIKK